MAEQIKQVTAEDRAKHLKQSNANQAIEGFHPDESDKQIQALYVAGTATTSDLLQHAKDFLNRRLGRVQ